MCQNSSTKHPIRFAPLFLANLCNYLSYKFMSLYRKFLICFALLLLINFCNSLSCILCRKFPIYFALLFLSNLCDSLSHTLCRKFPICYVSVFFGCFKSHICLEYIGNILHNILDKM